MLDPHAFKDLPKRRDVFLAVNDIVHNIQQQSWNHAGQYAAFWCWTLVVIFPISVTLYRWIEQPGIRFGERLLHQFERENRPPVKV